MCTCVLLGEWFLLYIPKNRKMSPPPPKPWNSYFSEKTWSTGLAFPWAIICRGQVAVPPTVLLSSRASDLHKHCLPEYVTRLSYSLHNTEFFPCPAHWRERQWDVQWDLGGSYGQEAKGYLPTLVPSQQVFGPRMPPKHCQLEQA